MGLSCGMSMVKYGLFIFNLICAIAGLALIIVGAIPLFKIADIEDAFPENNPAIFPILVLSLGCAIFAISFLGCCGAIRENQCMINLYAFALFVLLVLQVVAAVFAFVYTDDLAQIGEDGFTELFRNAQRNPGDVKYNEAVNGIQRALQCCGMDGPSDWLRPPSTTIPLSCCEDRSSGSCPLNQAFPRGCNKELRNVVTSNGIMIAWVSAGFALFLLLGVIFACCLTNSIRNANRRGYV